MQHRGTLYAARSRAWSTELGCSVSRVIGYGWSCSCGERGRLSSTLAAARAAHAEHRREAEELAAE